MIQIQFSKDLSPACPHCEREFDSLWARRMAHNLGKAYVHACPRCLRVVGVTHRKGFFMG